MKIITQFIFVVFLLLMGGCASINNMEESAISHEISYQIENLEKRDVRKVARIGRAKDTDILKKFGNPYSIKQLSDERKEYLYSYSKIEDLSPERKRSIQKNLIFKFNQKNKLAFWDFSEKNRNIKVSTQQATIIPEVESADILMRMIERIPKNANKSRIKKYLGEPTDISWGEFFYEYKKASSAVDFAKPELYRFSFEFKRNNIVKNILLDQAFFEKIKEDADFNMKIVTWEFREASEEEKSAIEQNQNTSEVKK